MKHSRELTVGISIIVAAVLFFVGVRFFEDVPIFRGTYDLYTEFDDAQGLTTGNAVRVRGVNVGSVGNVTLNEETKRVRVEFQVDRGVEIPQGTTARIEGISALNGVRIDLQLGPPDNEQIASGGFVPGAEQRSMSELVEQAPVLLSRLDSALLQADQTFEQAEVLLRDAQPELTQTLQSMRSMANTLESTVGAQQVRLTATLTNLEAASGDLRTFTSENRDSLDLLVQRMNRAFSLMSARMEELESTSTSLNAIMARIEQGEGTLGRLAADPALYQRLDSALVSLNQLIADFQSDPGRYLKELGFIDLF